MKNSSIFTGDLQGNSITKSAIKDILEARFGLNFNKKKYVKFSYQYLGLRIAYDLDDTSNIPLYIKLAREQDKTLLESAVSYVKDYPNPKSKKGLFLWFLKGKLKPTKSSSKRSKGAKSGTPKRKVGLFSN